MLSGNLSVGRGHNFRPRRTQISNVENIPGEILNIQLTITITIPVIVRTLGILPIVLEYNKVKMGMACVKAIMNHPQ